MKQTIIALLSSFLSSAVFAETFVYVSESKDKKIAVWSLNESHGDLKRLGEVELSGAVGCLWPSSDKTKLYASVRGASQFATLAIDRKRDCFHLLESRPQPGAQPISIPTKPENGSSQPTMAKAW